MALWRRKAHRNVIVDTDQGGQYCSAEYQAQLKRHNLRGKFLSLAESGMSPRRTRYPSGIRWATVCNFMALQNGHEEAVQAYGEQLISAGLSQYRFGDRAMRVSRNDTMNKDFILNM